MRILILLVALAISAQVHAGEILDVAVSVLPQRQIVERIGGDTVRVQVLVEPGESPAAFAMTPRELSGLARADILFTVGVPFDSVLVSKLEAVAPDLEVVDMARDVERLPMSVTERSAGRRGQTESRPTEDHHGEGDHQRDGHYHPAGGLDPHVWLDPHRVSFMAVTVRDALCELAPMRCEMFSQNLNAYRTELDDVDSRIRKRLAPFAGREVCVFHPAYGYFTERYGLHQLAVEVEGKSPTPRQLATLIETFDGSRIGAIFVQPQFASQSARAVAKGVGADLVELDPLAADHLENLERLANRIAEALSAR